MYDEVWMLKICFDFGQNLEKKALLVEKKNCDQWNFFSLLWAVKKSKQVFNIQHLNCVMTK